MQVVGHVADLQHLRHAMHIRPCATHVNGLRAIQS
jgi:hypothetical protein